MTEAKIALVILVLLALHQWEKLWQHLGAPQNVICVKLHEVSKQSSRVKSDATQETAGSKQLHNIWPHPNLHKCTALQNVTNLCKDVQCPSLRISGGKVPGIVLIGCDQEIRHQLTHHGYLSVHQADV